MIYATEETCGVMRQDLERMRNDPAVDITGRAGIRCTPVTTTGSAPSTQILRLDVLEPVAQVVAFRHLNSVAVPRDPTYPPLTTLPEADPRDPRLFPRGISLDPGSPPLPGQMDLTTGGNASLFFQITMRSAPNFSVAYQDTAGALKEGTGANWDGTPADGQRITDILTRMSPTDVFLGTVGTNNFGNNGLRDIVHYQQALKPKIFIPNHLTTGSRYMGESKSPSVYASYLEQLRNMGISETARARIRWLTDPMDYLRPLVYDLREPTWADHRKRARLKHFDRYPMARG